MYEYDLATIYMLINQHNDQERRKRLLGINFLTADKVEDLEKDIKDKTSNNTSNQNSDSEYQEMRAVNFL